MLCSDAVPSILNQTNTNKYFIEYDGFLTNHVSHGIIALHRLGAQPERIKRFVDWYTPKLESAETDIDDDRPFEQQKGQRVAFYKITKEYEKRYQLLDSDVNQLVKQEYPKLSAGLAGSALHGTIHLGYNFVAGNVRGVLEGLAYTHHSFRPVVSKKSSEELAKFGNGATSILEVLDKVRNNKELCESIIEGSEMEKYTALKVGKFQRAVGFLCGEKGDALLEYVLAIAVPSEVKTTKGTLDPSRLARRFVYWTVLVYTMSENKNDFFLLHGVTCAWSIYHIVTVLDENESLNAVRNFAATLIAVYIAQGAPALNIPVQDCEPSDQDWETLIKRVLDDDRDEHTYKLLQVCREMMPDAASFGEDANVYFQAAKIGMDTQEFRY
ncbi:uncharacterized protein LOC128216918 isoform X2 [Mya arenaria]|nr:uncharacterized protein LOC128216918 isoform X2 [Mya arenaria]XP_052779591.1 uncharacterized protein LOC128216918 isoform X2 [Mya arenaria]XP_052779592.1 uncharacterized protein LOC128216918 isoform X2 [Mya arenaria]